MKNRVVMELCTSPDLGGLELFMVDTVLSLEKDCEVIVVVNENSKLEQYFKTKAYITLKKSSQLKLFFKAKVLANIIDEKRVGVIHIHWSKDILLAVLAKLFSSSKPKLIQSRHMTMTRFKSDFYHKWLYKNIDTIHAVTHQVKEQLIRYIPSDVRPKIEVVYLGVEEMQIDKSRVEELKRIYKIEDEFIVGMVGRIQENKGQYLLIEAIDRLRELNIKALIIGHSMQESYLQELKERVESLKLQDKIIFVGFTKEVNEHINIFDVSVLATKKETFGLVVVESMINSVPVIATNQGGPLEIIEDGVDGMLFERGVDDLRLKIETLYRDKNLKQQLSHKAYSKVKKEFNKERQMQKLKEVICES